MSIKKSVIHIDSRADPKEVSRLVEKAVRSAPENTARALTPAEDQARRTIMEIAMAEANAKAEIDARSKK